MTARSRLLNRLRKRDVEVAKLDDKPLSDGGGLYFVPRPAPGWWKFKYLRPKAYGGKESSLSFGKYPHVDLTYAREQRDAALKDLARDIDPSAKRKSET